jgi:hypothetical protein
LDSVATQSSHIQKRPIAGLTGGIFLLETTAESALRFLLSLSPLVGTLLPHCF